MTCPATSFNPDTQAWALQQWGRVDLGDARLTRRAVTIGTRLAAAPSASLPQQMADWAELVDTYRLLDNAKVSHTALSQPHWQTTRQQAQAAALVLLVQDTTVLNYSHYARSMAGLGPVGDGRGQGLLLHTTLAILPQPRQVLGIAHQQVYLRRHHPERPANDVHPQTARRGCGARR